MRVFFLHTEEHEAANEVFLCAFVYNTTNNIIIITIIIIIINK